MVTDKEIDSNTCLNLAEENGHCAEVNICIEKKDFVCIPNMFLLHMTADILERKLVEPNARIHTLNKPRQPSQPNIAAQSNHILVEQFLIDREADIERRDEENYAIVSLTVGI